MKYWMYINTSLIDELLICDPIFCDRKQWKNIRFEGRIEEDHNFRFGHVNSKVPLGVSSEQVR